MPPEPTHPSSSATPLIASDVDDNGGTSPAADLEGTEKSDPKKKKGFLGFLGKKEEKGQIPSAASRAMDSSVEPATPAKGQELRPTAQPIPASPSRHPYPSLAGASSSHLRSPSPRLHSPASSEIFERNVQEPVPISTLQDEHSAEHIPTHVMTEDHIPPALEATAEAITSKNLGPDEVEIVMSSSHLPAAASVLEGSSMRDSQADITSLQSPMSPLQPVRSEDSEKAASGILPPAVGEEGDGASNYAHLDPNDVRRLSFISFADVVQSEHQQLPSSALGEPGSRDSLHMASLPSSFSKTERAASPLRSPPQTHSQASGVVTPPPAGLNFPSTGSESQGVGPVGSPGSRLGSTASPSLQQQGHGDLTVETMRQAVRKTASGDLSGAAGRGSTALSPVSSDGDHAGRSRGNS